MTALQYLRSITLPGSRIVAEQNGDTSTRRTGTVDQQSKNTFSVIVTENADGSASGFLMFYPKATQIRRTGDTVHIVKGGKCATIQPA